LRIFSVFNLAIRTQAAAVNIILCRIVTTYRIWTIRSHSLKMRPMRQWTRLTASTY
jgi:hypothetical protein